MEKQVNIPDQHIFCRQEKDIPFDLVRRLCNALDTAKETIEQLAAEEYINPDDPRNNLPPEKVIGETAFFLLVASLARDHKEVDKRVEHLASILIPYARTEKTLLEICLHPTLAMEYAQAHICLTKLGYPDARFDALLLETVGCQSHYGRERPPHRVLEQQWIKKNWHLNPVHPNGADDVLNYSALVRTMDLLHGTKDDMYAFTHALMYAADFNTSAWKLPREREEIINEAEAMLARCLDEQDYDLVGELLLTWPLTGNSWSPASIFALRVVTSVEDKVGFLPSPATNAETLDKLEGNDKKKYRCATTYHTAYVMGLLCAVSLQNERMPSNHLPTRVVEAGSANKILHFLDHDKQDRHWVDEFKKLTYAEQDSLAGFLLNIALARNIQNKQYAAAYELIRIGYGLGIANTPMASQTAELLERLAILSSLT